MDEKTIKTLEYPKVLERLASYAAFSVSVELAQALRPTDDLELALQRQTRTSEARRLLSTQSEVGVGGARDIRSQVDLADHAGVLEPAALLDVKYTLIAARQLAKVFEHHAVEYPTLSAIAASIQPPFGLIDAISRAISDHGDMLDQASEKLSSIRKELRSSHDRLMTRLDKLINDSRITPMLQEPIITQRNGRYVVPLRADFKGRLRAIIHDQSSSGATLFVEPLVVVDLNNRWHELQLAERDEERRILIDLSGQIGRSAGQILQTIAALAELDLAFMCAKYAEDIHAVEPVLQSFQTARDSHPGSTMLLYKARHPLLDQEKVVPIDIDLDEQTFALVITGPNTGGKTVTLKTAGLLVLMAQSGLHIPAQSGSCISIFQNVFADIGDEQSIEQSLSTFSGHITNIIRIMKQSTMNSLVLLDELGAGTDPQEGAALARAMLAYLIQKRITCLVATHYPELKAFAHTTPGAVNASMEFNLRTLKPTYHLTIGLPGRSNALLIAERLGLDKEIIQDARRSINPQDLHADNLLDEIHRQRNAAQRARDAAEREQREAERVRAELSARLSKIESERLDLLEKARLEAEAEVSALRAELEEVRRGLLHARQPLDLVKPLQSQLEDLQADLEIPVRPQEKVEPVRPFKIGEKIRVRSLKMEGQITALDKEEAEVQAGALHMRARLEDIQRLNEPSEPAPLPALPAKKKPVREDSTPKTPFHPSPGIELDLRGQRAEDALLELDQYLESAYLAGLPFVRIIHGKGTGRLRQVVREALQQIPHVTHWENGLDNEGGDGVTVVHLMPE
ncbi:MAG TPA: endonuclease MutS2 [Anaerolineaceae bacterium]|nr:endonuclease MutS2 [Anaerolineaceae bacterium]